MIVVQPNDEILNDVLMIDEKHCCMFLWNVPKVFLPRPGPWKSIDKIMLSLASGVTALFPVYWLWKDKLLFVLYILTGLSFVITLKRYECGRCTYFHCINNSVPEAIRIFH